VEMASLYARAVARRLPLLGGGGDDVLPDLQPEREGVVVDPERLAAYDRVCGFRLRDEVPATYPHVLAFPLALRLLTDRSFPFGAMGLVHVGNRITQRRPLRLGEAFDLRVRAENLAAHAKGRTVDLVAEAIAGDELVWEDVSTYLHREAGSDRSDGSDGGAKQRQRSDERAEAPARAIWSVADDVGRRYAAVSGDRNPIHLHALSAKLFGMPRAIAHGMWLKARCLAALEDTLPDAYTVDVRFKLPLYLPGKVAFWSAADGSFGVRSARDGKPHLAGELSPGAA
jgi:acyl dehydratase